MLNCKICGKSISYNIKAQIICADCYGKQIELAGVKVVNHNGHLQT